MVPWAKQNEGKRSERLDGGRGLLRVGWERQTGTHIGYEGASRLWGKGGWNYGERATGRACNGLIGS